MELRHLRCFVAVAEELHFGKAAERLHLSQPPVSLAIKELESELGVMLFERTSRRISLTRIGEEMLKEARTALASAEAMRRLAKDECMGTTGTISIAFISLAAYAFLPDLLREFSSAYPRVKVQLRESTTDRIIEDLEQGRLDLGFGFLTPQQPAAIANEILLREPLVVALPAGHPQASRKAIDLRDLANENFLGFERYYGPLMFDAIVATCMRHGFSPRMFPATQMHTIVSLVSGGLGVALVPACVTVQRREGVTYRPMLGEKTYVETCAMWRQAHQSPVLLAFLKLMAERQSSA
ncbi:LysR family transcriptional regulator [Diaphorobacter ruginosibacter]|uniref:LysR family transcriptional regulator n=1 Tax=Diaphorobacter ruginosibacter TaxID=1715720 RepID=A0A7G9RIR1_9BURK|nr:LysR family transcriptional regulator [Diaphorobacter ruginosibacter]QNN55486.1 LysR family transcriptional regulator [Diaphorobacter ruginosibacter]